MCKAYLYRKQLRQNYLITCCEDFREAGVLVKPTKIKKNDINKI